MAGRMNRLQKLLRDASPGIAQAMLKVQLSKSSYFEEIISEMRRRALAELAEEFFTWVSDKQGRRVVLEWEGDGLVLQRFEPDGTPVQEEGHEEAHVEGPKTEYAEGPTLYCGHLGCSHRDGHHGPHSWE